MGVLYKGLHHATFLGHVARSGIGRIPLRRAHAPGERLRQRAPGIGVPMPWPRSVSGQTPPFAGPVYMLGYEVRS